MAGVRSLPEGDGPDDVPSPNASGAVALAAMGRTRDAGCQAKRRLRRVALRPLQERIIDTPGGYEFLSHDPTDE